MGILHLILKILHNLKILAVTVFKGPHELESTGHLNELTVPGMGEICVGPAL